MLQQQDARLRSRNSTVSVKAETAECLVARDSILSRDAYIKEPRLFMYILNYSDIIFRFRQIVCRLCVNAFFGASINLILFFDSNNGKQGTCKQNRKKCGISLRTIKVCRFEIIDGVKYVNMHAYKFLLREQLGFAAVL